MSKITSFLEEGHLKGESIHLDILETHDDVRRGMHDKLRNLRGVTHACHYIKELSRTRGSSSMEVSQSRSDPFPSSPSSSSIGFSRDFLGQLL